jgi:hypothetical protein
VSALRLQLGMLSILLILGALLPGCTTEDKRLDFDTILPDEWSPYATYRLDTNADGENEWVILYSYDEKEQEAFTPVGGVIYHADRGKPPVVFPYPLVAPGWTYLGEGKSTIEVNQVLSESPDPEVVFQSVDSADVTTRVALFHWQDHAPNKVLPPVADETMGQWYHCVGQFSGDGGVKLEVNQVTVWERTEERSQLAVRKTYRPLQGSYINPGDKQLIAPVETCLDFSYGQPKDVDKSPYPEKVLMAFYSHFTTDQAYTFLTPGAQEGLRKQAGDWGRIAPWPRTAVTGICVKELNYTPDTEPEVQATMVAQAQEQHIAQATAVAQAAECPCPEPQCTCPPTPTEVPTSPPVWVTARVEYTLQTQRQQRQLRWGLVKINGIWRIDRVIPLQ